MWPFGKKKRSVVEAGARLLTRSFAAAEVSELLGEWRWDGGFSNQEIPASLATMRSRSRDMHKNNGDFRRYLSLFCANVVGPDGFYLKSDAVLSTLDPKLDRDAAFTIEYHFKRWATNRSFADVTGVKDFPSICRLAALHWARDGEAFIMLNRSAQNRYGLSLRVVRPDACPEWYNGTAENGNWIRKTGS